MLKKLSAIAVLLGLVALVYNTDAMKQRRIVNELVAQNIEARGGVEAWRAVASLRLTGQMDLGKGMIVPYVIEQKRPGKMRLEYVFNGETAVQSSDANEKTGWKVMPFRGRTAPEPMTERELRETGDSADPYGMLFDHADRGIELELQGKESVAGRDAFKLKVILPLGAVRWVYLDAETGLEVKLEALRTLAGREFRVETIYHDWQEVEGLLISHRQETQTDGDTEWHFLTVDRVNINPSVDDSRFVMPLLADAKN